MRKLLIPLLLVVLAVGCKKHDTNPLIGGWYDIEIKATSNIDCHLPEIVFLTGQKEAYSILGDSRGVYIGLGLPKVLYPVGTKLSVHIKKPMGGEDITCTTVGVSWAHALITEVQF